MKFQLVNKETNEIVAPQYIALTPNGELYSYGMNVTEHFHIRRFTGLKDSNNNDIFEGDLVQFLDWKPKEIVFQDKAFAGYTLKGTDLFLTTYDAINMTVIGNVYQL
jgi:hypothetical protein